MEFGQISIGKEVSSTKKKIPSILTNINELHQHWFNVDLNDWPNEDININFLELVPIYFGIRRMTAKFQNVHILCYTDNTQCCSMINKGISANNSCMSLLREIFWVCVLANCCITAVYIPGIQNHIPDMISRMVDDELSAEFPDFLCCSPSASRDRPRTVECNLPSVGTEHT